MSYLQAGGNFVGSPSYIGNTAGPTIPVVSGTYVEEDGTTIYTAEDGVSPYVTEV